MRIGPAFLQTFAVQLLQTAASIITGIVIARGLGPTGQGQYAVLLAGVGLLSTMAAAGQFEGNVLTSAGQQSQGRILVVRSVCQAALAGALVLATNGMWRSASALSGNRSVAVILSLIVMAEVLALLFRGINLGQHQITAYNVATLIQRFVYLIIVSAVGLLAGLRLATVLEAWLVAVLLNVLFTGVGIWRRSNRVSLSWRTLADGWIASLTRGLRALLTVCLTLLLVRADVYMLGRMLGVEAVGQISVATTFAEYLWYIPSILGSMLFAVVAANRGPQSIERICRSTRLAVALLAPVAIVLLLIGRPLIPLIYGTAYARAGTLLVLLVPGMFAISVHLVLDSYFAGKGFPPISYLGAAGALATKVLLNLAVVPRFGLEGAAVVTSGVYGLLLWLKVGAFTRETGVSVSRVLRPSKDDVVRGLTVIREWLSLAVRPANVGRP